MNTNEAVRYIASRQDLRPHTTHYVVSLPVKEPGNASKGDFGYDTDISKAIPLSLWWMRRWAAQMRFCGRKPIVQATDGDTIEDSRAAILRATGGK